MKTNVIHVLIIAIILIAGWSLFTMLQDFYNTDTNAYRNYSVVGKGRQYLPLNPQDYSGGKKYPVYKPSSSVVARRDFSDGNGSLSLKTKDEAYVVNEVYYEIQRGNESGKLRSMDKRNPENDNNLSLKRSNSQMMKPFSKSMNIDARRNIADASVSSTTSGSVSEGSSMMRVFGNDEEGDAIEGGGGTDNPNFYNDVPVGDGMLFLFIMLMLYSLYITLKVSVRISLKK